MGDAVSVDNQSQGWLPRCCWRKGARLWEWRVRWSRGAGESPASIASPFQPLPHRGSRQQWPGVWKSPYPEWPTHEWAEGRQQPTAATAAATTTAIASPFSARRKPHIHPHSSAQVNSTSAIRVPAQGVTSASGALRPVLPSPARCGASSYANREDKTSLLSKMRPERSRANLSLGGAPLPPPPPAPPPPLLPPAPTAVSPLARVTFTAVEVAASLDDTNLHGDARGAGGQGQV